MSKLLRKRGKISAAQAMVEFGLALPILLLVMYGLIESGRLLFLYASVVSAARQAVRYGSVTGDNAAGTPYYDDCAGIKSAAKRLGFIQPFSDSNIVIMYDNGPGATSPWAQTGCPIASAQHPMNGDRIYVDVSTQYTPIVPLVPFKPFTISSSGWRTLLVGVSVAVDVPGAPGPTGGTFGTLSMVKDAWCIDCSPPGPYFENVGNSITYTYTITNTGSAAVQVTSLTDDMIGGSIPIPSGFPNPLPGGGTSAQITATYLTKQGDVDLGKIINNARVEGLSVPGNNPSAATASKTINFVPKPQLALVKDGDLRLGAFVARGQPVDYTFTLTNVGNVKLTGPYNIQDLSNIIPAGTIVCPPGPDLPPDGNTSNPTKVVCTGTHALTGSDISARSVSNNATATALYNGFTVTSNQSSKTVLVPALLLTMYSCNTLDSTGNCPPPSGSPPVVPPPATVTALNQTVYYTYTLSNRSGAAMWYIYITASRGPSGFQCLTTLAKLATASCTRSYNTYTQADMDNPLGQFLNTASAMAWGGKPSNSASVAVNVTQLPSFTLGKKGPAGVVSTLSPITYTFRFTNTGNVTLTAPFTVADSKTLPQGNCSGLPGPLAPNNWVECTRTYTVTTADLAAGSILNTATATATFNGFYDNTNGVHTIPSTPPAATATVMTYDGPRVGAVVTADTNYYGALDQKITFTYSVRNTGNKDLIPPYTVTDTNLSLTLTCPSTPNPLPPTQSVQCGTHEYLVTAADMAATSITENATATAGYGGPEPLAYVGGSVTLLRFMCDSTHVTITPTPVPPTSDDIWTVANGSGQDLHVTSITISWSSGPPYLTNVYWNGAQLWSGLSPSSGGFAVPMPVGGLLLPSGASMPLEAKLTGAPGGPSPYIRVQITFQESGCLVLKSVP